LGTGLKSGDPPWVNTNGPPDHKEAELLMASVNPMDRHLGDPLSSHPGGTQIQSAVPSTLLSQHPVLLTYSELAWEVMDGLGRWPR
jgi:hypothetical protein